MNLELLEWAAVALGTALAIGLCIGLAISGVMLPLILIFRWLL